jgi:hypothetical protein
VQNGVVPINDPRFIFPRDVLGRIVLFVASAFWAPVFGFVAYMFLVLARPVTVEGWVVTVIVGELGVAGALFFGAGLIWSVCMPHWLEAFVVRSTRTLMLWLAAFGLLSLPYALWACFCA